MGGRRRGGEGERGGASVAVATVGVGGGGGSRGVAMATDGTTAAWACRHRDGLGLSPWQPSPTTTAGLCRPLSAKPHSVPTSSAVSAPCNVPTPSDVLLALLRPTDPPPRRQPVPRCPRVLWRPDAVPVMSPPARGGVAPPTHGCCARPSPTADSAPPHPPALTHPGQGAWLHLRPRPFRSRHAPSAVLLFA